MTIQPDKIASDLAKDLSRMNQVLGLVAAHVKVRENGNLPIIQDLKSADAIMNRATSPGQAAKFLEAQINNLHLDPPSFFAAYTEKFKLTPALEAKRTALAFAQAREVAETNKGPLSKLGDNATPQQILAAMSFAATDPSMQKQAENGQQQTAGSSKMVLGT